MLIVQDKWRILWIKLFFGWEIKSYLKVIQQAVFTALTNILVFWLSFVCEGSMIDVTFDAATMGPQEGALTTDRHPATMIPTWTDVEVTHQAETTMATNTEVEAQEGLPQGTV